MVKVKRSGQGKHSSYFYFIVTHCNKYFPTLLAMTSFYVNVFSHYSSDRCEISVGYGQ